MTAMRGTILKISGQNITETESEFESEKKFVDPNPKKMNSDPQHWL
jgi:hypothetical protein